MNGSPKWTVSAIYDALCWLSRTNNGSSLKVVLVDCDAEMPPFEQSAMAHFCHIFYRGELDFEVEGPRGVDGSELYPHYKYVTAQEYLKRFV